MFFIHHIDSLLQICLGVAFTWMAYGMPGRWPPRTVRVFRVAGPLLMVVSGLLLLAPQPPASWHREFTQDKVASVEFPGAVKSAESTDTVGTVSVKRVSLSHTVPGKDLSLFCSYSALPDAARGMTEAQRIESTIANLTSQGSQVMQNEQLAGSPTIHRLTVRNAATNVTTQMALAYVNDKVYRIGASWAEADKDLELTDRFVSSFRITPR